MIRIDNNFGQNSVISSKSTNFKIMPSTLKESSKRTLAKTITWRLVGRLDTFLFSWLFVDHVDKASRIAAVDTVIKLILYYFHERIWQRIPLGFFRSLLGSQREISDLKRESHIRSITKSLSWRILGSLVTVFIVMILYDDMSVAWSIGSIEFLSKFVLFYIHERLWQLIPRGQFRKLIKSQ